MIKVNVEVNYKAWHEGISNWGKYMKYLCQKDKMLCANTKCLNSKGNRSKWSRKNGYGSWTYTEGEYKDCAVVRMIGKLEVTTVIGIDNASEIKVKEWKMKATSKVKCKR